MKYGLLFFLALTFSCKDISIEEVLQKEILLMTESLQNKDTITFVAGFDGDKKNYYQNAKKHSKVQGVPIVDTYYSLVEIIGFLNQNTTENYEGVDILCHSNPCLEMSLKTIKNGERITTKSLSEAKEIGAISILKKGITDNSKVIFHFCELGQNRVLLTELKTRKLIGTGQVSLSALNKN